jgi:Tol biopolymer transport system component/predicted Ser/Thr protein kinase
MIGKTISHYHITEKLGEGGMGVVYKAEDLKLKRTVALKFLSLQVISGDEERARFLHEAQAAAALSHPNICTVHEIDEVDGHSFIAMECIEGQSLQHKIATRPLKLDEVLDIACQIAEGLHEAHQKGIVHRDIKPANVMVTGKGRVKIMDFGLATSAAVTRVTKVGTTLGTIAYMSPEQARGEEVDPRTDIWSLGVVIHEMVTGQRPFKGDHEQAILYSILNETAEPITGLRSAIPIELERIANKAMAKEPKVRYQHADEMLADLRALRQGRESGVTQVGTVKTVRRRKNQLWSYSRFAAIVILLIAGGIFLMRWIETRKIGAASQQASQADMARPLRVILRQATFSEALEEYPAFSPDGSQLVYSRETNGYKHIFIKNLETGEETQVTKGSTDDIQPVWSPRGDAIVFVRSSQSSGKLEPGDVFGVYREGDIWAVALGSDKERKIIEDAFNPSFSPDGEWIAFDASWAGPRRIWIADDYGRNPQQVSFDSSEYVSQILPRWSPDGAKIVFQNLEKEKYNIKTVDLASQKMDWITNDLYKDINPVWSRSGDEIYFSSYRSGGLNIWRIPVNQSGQPSGPLQQVTAGAGQDVQLAISFDGKRLAFSILKQNADIWKLPVSPETGMPTGEPLGVIATTREDSRGTWSADGQKVAFNSDRTGEMNIWVYSLDEGRAWQVTKGPGGDFQPNWSPDGNRLAFFSSRAGNADIWVIEIVTGELRQLTTGASLEINPFFSPDGRYIAYQSDLHGRMEVWIMEADGTVQRQLTNVGVGGHFLAWTEDGQHIIFNCKGAIRQVSVDGGDSDPFAKIKGGGHISFSRDYSRIIDVVEHKTMWVSPLGLEEPYVIFEFADLDIRIDYPVWSPDGRWILFDRLKPQGGDIWLVEDLE